MEERKIGEYGYQVTQFGSKHGLKIAVRLMNLIGPAIKAGESGDGAAAMGELFNSLKPDDVLTLAEEFAKSTKVVLTVDTAAGPQLVPQPLAPLFDSHFVDRYDELAEYIVFAATLNFGKSLFRGKAIGPKLLEIVSPYLSRATSNGSGSESSPVAATT